MYANTAEVGKVLLPNAWVWGKSNKELEEVVDALVQTHAVSAEDMLLELRRIRSSMCKEELYMLPTMLETIKEVMLRQISFKALQWKVIYFSQDFDKCAQKALRFSRPKEEGRGIEVSMYIKKRGSTAIQGGLEGLYEAVILAPPKNNQDESLENWHKCFCTPIANSVIRDLTEEAVTQLMQRIETCDDIKECTCKE